MTMLKPLSYDTLGQIGAEHDNAPGLLAAAVEQELKRIAQDLHNRPALDKDRLLKIEVRLRPVPTDGGALDDATMKFSVSSVMPKRESRKYVVMPGPDGRLETNDVSPSQPRQHTLDEVNSND